MNGISRIGANPGPSLETIYLNWFLDGKKNKPDGKEAALLAGSFDRADFMYVPEQSLMEEVTAVPGTEGNSERSKVDMRLLSDAVLLSRKSLSAFREIIRRFIAQQAEKNLAQRYETAGLDPYEKEAEDTLNALKELTKKKTDDFWSADATAQRIFDFAVNLSGGSEENMAKLKDAVHKAFGECEQMFGGTLPDISCQTLDKINSLFEDFEKNHAQQTAGL